jgi:hypothetical protein
MAVSDIVKIRTGAIELLATGPEGARYTDALGDNNADYTVKQEITDAALAIDFEICGDIIDDPESPSGTRFMFPSANLANLDFIPDHEGSRGPVELSDGITWHDGLLANSEDEITEMLASPTLYQNVGLFYFIKLRRIVHNASAARIYLPTLTLLATCQSHPRYEQAIKFGTVMALEKDGADKAFFQKYETLYMNERARLRATRGVITAEIPDARERSQ